MSWKRRLRALASDRRARIPFALIGIFLLLTAGAVLLHAQTQTDATESLDPDRAMERTDAAIQTATRDAVRQASEKAAQQPLTETADTEYGDVIEAYSVGSDDPFDAYLRALIYLEARETLQTAGQQVGGVETTVSLPGISDPDGFEEAIGRIQLLPGRENPKREPGTLQVTISDVTTVLRHDGDVIDRRTESVTVTVPTPVRQLHERTSKFQHRLNASVTEAGFAQRFNARIYALGWARGYAQYNGMPVTEVLANRHVIPSANDAVYRTQQNVFGAADPQLNNAVRRGWLCMAMQDAEGLYNGYNRTNQVDYAEDLCEASGWLFGDQTTGELPDAPGVTDLIGSAPGMDAERTIGVNETAYLPLRRLASSAGEHSIERAIDRIYQIESRLDISVSDVSKPEFDHDPPDIVGESHGKHLSTTNEDTTVTVEQIAKHSDPEQYYSITGHVEITLEDEREYSYSYDDETDTTTSTAFGTLTAEFEMQLNESETGPNANIDEYQSRHGTAVEIDPDKRYDPGPNSADSRTMPTVPAGSGPDGFENYEGAEQEILTAFAGGTDDGDIEQWLEDRWNEVTHSSELPATERRTVSINQSAQSETILRATVLQDIRQRQEEISDVSVQFERREIIHANDEQGPYGKLLSEVREQKAQLLQRSEPYENVGQKAVYEVRYAYFESLESDLERLESANDEAMSALDDELGDLGLGSALTYLQQGVTATPPDPVPLNSSSLTTNISYEVSGSPTYLVAEKITTEAVPAVKNDIDEFAPLAVRNRNYLKLPYESVVDGLLGRISEFLGFGDPDAKLTLRMAGEALQAGQLAEAAAESGEYADQHSLDEKTDELKDGVELAIEQFRVDVTRQILVHLYPTDIQLPCTGSDWCSRATTNRIEDKLGEDVSCARGQCEYNVDKTTACTSIRCKIENGTRAEKSKERIAEAATEAIERTGDTDANTAIAIDNGNVTDPLVEEVTEQVDEPQYRPAYATETTDEQWRAYVTSAVQPAVRRAASSGGVILDDTKTVENLDTEVRRALENASRDIVEERLQKRLSGQNFSIGSYDEWVGGVRKPVRAPAGMPLLPVPSHWYATANVWDVELNGEYARFEVTANMGPPETGGTTTYVREARQIDREIAGESRRLGRVEPIEFSGRSVLVVVVPPGGVGVGDRDDDDPECSPTWPESGPVDRRELGC